MLVHQTDSDRLHSPSGVIRMTVPIDFEAIIEEVYEAILRPGDVAIDIGAHAGRHSIPMAKCVGVSGKVFAVEPLPECRAELQIRLERECPELFAVMQLIPAALWDRPGEAEFIIAEDWPAHSGLRPTPYPTPTPVRKVPVHLETLDDLCADWPALHFVKLDAEGAELHILKGGLACLERFRPVIAFEFGTITNREFGVEPSDMAH